MPAYEYHCSACGKDFILYLSISEYEKKPKIACEHCKSDKVEKKLTTFYSKTSKKS
jgi:putative FmdB family regulatory protein